MHFLYNILLLYLLQNCHICVSDCTVQELKSSAADARHRVDELLGLSQSMLSVVKDSPTKSGIKQKLHRLHSSLQHIDTELGLSTLLPSSHFEFSDLMSTTLLM